jgi:uncharacterized protein (DUF1330 family)
VAVYFIVDVNIDDRQSYAEYSKQVGLMVARYGGRFLVRGGATSTIERGLAAAAAGRDRIRRYQALQSLVRLA